MKKIRSAVILTVTAAFCAVCALGLFACGPSEYLLNEGTFFLVMTNMQYYPGQYLNKNIEYDCFTYRLEDVYGNSYLCGVRKCSSGYGCNCGRDTIIGFLLDYDGEIPEPKNQSEDTNDKTWVHLKGKLKSADKKSIVIHAYDADGSVIEGKNETIQFLTFDVETVSVIGDTSGLHYYVTK